MGVLQLLSNRVYKFSPTQFFDGIWNDASDATFITISRTTNSSGGGTSQSTYGWIAPLNVADLPVELEECTGIRLRMRAKGTMTGGGNVVFDTTIGFANPGGSTSLPFTDFPFLSAAIPCDGVIHDLSFDATADDLSYFNPSPGEPSGLLRALKRLTTVGTFTGGSLAGQRAIRFATSSTFGTVQPPSTTRTLTIYEAWLEIVYPDPPMAIAGQQEGTRIRFI